MFELIWGMKGVRGGGGGGGEGGCWAVRRGVDTQSFHNLKSIARVKMSPHILDRLISTVSMTLPKLDEDWLFEESF